MIKKHHVEELKKCSESVEYFIRQYGWINHLELGPIRLVPWDWQVAHFLLWQSWKSTITLKGRQMGFSWCAVAFINWVMTFRPNFNILLLSAKEEKAIKLLGKLKFFRNRLPGWMRSHGVSSSKNFTQFMRYYDSGLDEWMTGEGTVWSLTTTSTSGAGDSATIVLVDEFALMSERGNDEGVWAAISPTALHGGLIMTGSTPRHSAGQFYLNWNSSIEPLMDDGVIDDHMPYRTWNRVVLARARTLPVVPIKAHYSMCYHDDAWIAELVRGLPEIEADKLREHFSAIKYDDAWRQDIINRLKLTKAQVAQELDLEFDQPGGQAFDMVNLNRCYVPAKRSPMIQELSKGSKYYFIGVDTAEGVTAKNKEPDYNSIVGFNKDGIQVIAEHNRENLDVWAGRTEVDPLTGKPREILGTVAKIILAHRPCTVVVEANGMAQTVINRITPHMKPDVKLFPLSMSSNKSQLVNDMGLALADQRLVMWKGQPTTIQSLTLTDFFTFLCFKHFVKIGPGKYGAAGGFFDDPVIAALWAAYAMRITERMSARGVMPSKSSKRDTEHIREIEKVEKESNEDPLFNDVTPDKFSLVPARREPIRGRAFSGSGRSFSGNPRSFGS